MAIKPTAHSIRVLFEQNHTFEVPKYQRNYAWDEDAIEDFVDDLAKCLAARRDGRSRQHFFGGIVTVRKGVPNSNRSNYEVIDGQQRLASFVMLAAALIRGINDTVGDPATPPTPTPADQTALRFLRATSDALRALYLTHKDNIDLEYVDVPKLRLSKEDDDFFQRVINGNSIPPSCALRASHERIQAAWKRLDTYVQEDVLNTPDLSEKARRVRLLVNSVLGDDCTVIFIHTETQTEAYRIFQVLNDRGVQLTDGDLLRARTMELLDHRDLATEQEAVALEWGHVLADPPATTDDYLRWYFSSVEGRRPRRSDLAEQFLECRFGCRDTPLVNKARAAAILAEVRQIHMECQLLRTLGDADWPYSDHGNTTRWERERLRTLVHPLKHTNAMPLLLALARHATPRQFADAVVMIERFVFRYKTIGNAHVGPMEKLYLSHAKALREAPPNWRPAALRKDLTALVLRVVPDSVFQERLRALTYAPREGNGHLRYLLMTLEDYCRWYEDGAHGMPRCRDQTRIFDFSTMTLEHIYPRSSKEHEKDAAVEEVKDTLGNLTLFSPKDNDSVANKSFAAKRDALKRSSLKLNRDVGGSDVWDCQRVRKRTDALAAMALKVFVP